MFDKKYFFLLLLFIVAIGAITAVSAGDVNQTDVVALNDDVETTEEIAISSEGNEIDATNSAGVLTADFDDMLADGDTNNQTSIVRVVSQSGSYLHNKVVKFQLTDLNGIAIPNEDVWIQVFKKGNDEDNIYFDDLETDSKGIVAFKFADTWVDSAGTYTLKAEAFDGTSNVEVVKDIKVYKKSLAIKVNNIVTTYKSGKTFNIRVVDSSGKGIGGVRLTVDIYSGKKIIRYFNIETKSNGYFKHKSFALPPGKYKVVITPYDTRYSIKSKAVAVKVNKKPLKISARRITNEKAGSVHIKVIDKITKKPVDGVKVTVRIYTGSKYKQFNLVTCYDSRIYKSHGIAAIETNKFAVGNHKVLLFVSHPNFRGSATSILKIPASSKQYGKYTGLVTNGKRVLM